MTAFDRWWQDWAARNEALYEESQRARELARARRWADAHRDFHFGQKENAEHDED